MLSVVCSVNTVHQAGSQAYTVSRALPLSSSEAPQAPSRLRLAPEIGGDEEPGRRKKRPQTRGELGARTHPEPFETGFQKEPERKTAGFCGQCLSKKQPKQRLPRYAAVHQ